MSAYASALRILLMCQHTPTLRPTATLRPHTVTNSKMVGHEMQEVDGPSHYLQVLLLLKAHTHSLSLSLTHTHDRTNTARVREMHIH